MAKLRILSAEDVRKALPMDQAIQGMKLAYSQLSSGKAIAPMRSKLDIPDYRGSALFMPAYLANSGDLAVKIVTVYPDNIRKHLPVIYASVLVLDVETGRPLALLDGATVTAIRTGAGAGAATDLLARRDACTVAIIGSGVQARTQLQAVCTVRRITEARVYSLSNNQANEFSRVMAGIGPVPDKITVVSSPSEAILGADIICTATTSSTPVFSGSELAPGIHINAIGAFTRDMQEVDVETIRRSYVVVDSREAVLEEAGDLIIPIAAGDISTEHIRAELGEIVLGLKRGRIDEEQVTYFKSVGVAVQDAVAARIALSNAVMANLGLEVDL